MRQMTPDEARKIQLDILNVVAAFCDERGIKYFITAGTLLGAVRHKGFIPWYDDIDVGMLRPDYERFMREFNGYNPRYEFYCPDNDSSYTRPFGRVFDTHTLCVYDSSPGFDGRGMSVDVFIYDNAPDDDNIARKMYRKRDFWIRMNFRRACKIFSHAEGNFLRRMCAYFFRAALRPLPIGYFSRKMDRLAKTYASASTRRVGDFTGTGYMLLDRRAMDSLIELEFEGKKYKAPAGYDEYLTQHYGDYMTPPPPEKCI